MEVWKDILGYEGLYQVSSLGRVKSVGRVVVHKNGVRRTIRGRMLKQGLSTSGYYKVNLFKKAKMITKDVHVLVAIAFKGHIPDGGFIIPHHINGIKTDNRANNLEVIPQREHTSHHMTNNSTGEANIYRIKEGTFKVEFWFSPENRDIYIGTYETIEEAIIVRDKKLAEVEAGTFVPPVRIYSSKYCCVYWHKATQKWRAVVKGKHIGLFITEEEAHQAVLKYQRSLEFHLDSTPSSK